jgi:hypothetical protein
MDDDLEFSDYGRLHGPKLLFSWLLFSFACLGVDGLLVWGAIEAVRGMWKT